VRIIDLPPYWPELNPCEQLWDIIKDEPERSGDSHSEGVPERRAPARQIGNRVFPSIRELRKATLPALRRFWHEPASVLRLVGRDWLLAQANATGCSLKQTLPTKLSCHINLENWYQSQSLGSHVNFFPRANDNASL
jgi:hypothetical protein